MGQNGKIKQKLGAKGHYNIFSPYGQNSPVLWLLQVRILLLQYSAIENDFEAAVNATLNHLLTQTSIEAFFLTKINLHTA